MKDTILLSILHFVNDGYLACLGLCLPFIANDITLSLGQSGFLGSVLNLASIVLAMSTPVITARFGNFITMAISSLFVFIAYLLVGLSSNFIMLLIAFLIASVGFGIFHPVAFSAIAKANDRNLGKVMGSFTANGDLGRVAFSALITFVIARFSWQKATLVYSAIPLMLSLFIFSKKRYRADIKLKAAADRIEKKKVPHKLTPDVIKILTATFFDNFSVVSLFLFLPFLLLEQKNCSATIVGSLTAIFFIGNYLGKMFLGFLIDSFSVKKIFLIAEVLIAVTIIVTVFIDGMVAMIVILVLLGAMTKGTVPVLNVFLAESAKEHDINIDFAFGLHELIVGIAATLSPVVLGQVANVFGIHKLFYLCAASSVLAFSIGIFIKEPSGKNS